LGAALRWLADRDTPSAPSQCRTSTVVWNPTGGDIRREALHDEHPECGRCGGPQQLSRIERAEAPLRQLGLAAMRVRQHGEIARVELPARLGWPPPIADHAEGPVWSLLRPKVPGTCC
jgi:hypothetical protein